MRPFASTSITDRIRADFERGWVGTADDWWAQHPDVTTINSIAPFFTYLKQEGLIVRAGERTRTRAGGLAWPYKGAA